MINLQMRRRSWLFKIFTLVFVCLFLANDLVLAISFNNTKIRYLEDEFLAPSTSVTKEEVQEKFRAGVILLSHGAVNRYIREQIEAILKVRGEDGLIKKTLNVNGQDVLVISIPHLLKKTGQFAHVGLGQQYGIPVIYIDGEFYNNGGILRHEIDEVSQWEDFRINVLHLERNQMRSWILANIDMARRKAKEFHQGAHKIDNLFRIYADRIDFDHEYINLMLTLYGPDEESKDVNIAAHDEGSSKDPFLQRVKGIFQSLQKRYAYIGVTLNEPKTLLARYAVDLRNGAIDEMYIRNRLEKAIEAELEYCGHSIPPSDDEKRVIDEVHGLVASTMESLGIPYKASDAIFVSGGFGPLSDFLCSSFFQNVFVFRRKHDLVLRHGLLHEECHFAGRGFIPKALDEGMTEYLVLKILMNFVEKIDYGNNRRAVLDFYTNKLFLELYVVDRDFSPAYVQAIEGIVRIMDVVGEEHMIKAYLTGDCSQIETMLGKSVWKQINDLAHRYERATWWGGKGMLDEYLRELDVLLRNSSPAGLIGKYMPTTAVEFTEENQSTHEGYIQFKAYHIEDPEKRVIDIKIKARKLLPWEGWALFAEYRSDILPKNIEDLLNTFLKNFRGAFYVLQPNPYGIDGIGALDTLAILNTFTEDDRIFNITKWHELAHGTINKESLGKGIPEEGTDLYKAIVSVINGGGDIVNAYLEEKASKYVKQGNYKDPGEFEKAKEQFKKEWRVHYALRLFQRQIWLEDDRRLTQELKGIPLKEQRKQALVRDFVSLMEHIDRGSSRVQMQITIEDWISRTFPNSPISLSVSGANLSAFVDWLFNDTNAEKLARFIIDLQEMAGKTINKLANELMLLDVPDLKIGKIFLKFDEISGGITGSLMTLQGPSRYNISDGSFSFIDDTTGIVNIDIARFLEKCCDEKGNLTIVFEEFYVLILREVGHILFDKISQRFAELGSGYGGCYTGDLKRVFEMSKTSSIEGEVLREMVAFVFVYYAGYRCHELLKCMLDRGILTGNTQLRTCILACVNGIHGQSINVFQHEVQRAVEEALRDADRDLRCKYYEFLQEWFSRLNTRNYFKERCSPSIHPLSDDDRFKESDHVLDWSNDNGYLGAMISNFPISSATAVVETFHDNLFRVGGILTVLVGSYPPMEHQYNKVLCLGKLSFVDTQRVDGIVKFIALLGAINYEDEDNWTHFKPKGVFDRQETIAVMKYIANALGYELIVLRENTEIGGIVFRIRKGRNGIESTALDEGTQADISAIVAKARDLNSVPSVVYVQALGWRNDRYKSYDWEEFPEDFSLLVYRKTDKGDEILVLNRAGKGFPLHSVLQRYGIDDNDRQVLVLVEYLRKRRLREISTHMRTITESIRAMIEERRRVLQRQEVRYSASVQRDNTVYVTVDGRFVTRDGRPYRGSPARLLETIRDNPRLFRKAISNEGFSVKELMLHRKPHVRSTVYKEVQILRLLGILEKVEGKPNYRFSDIFRGPTPEYTISLINSVMNIEYSIGNTNKPLERYDIPKEEMPFVRGLVNLTVDAESTKYLLSRLLPAQKMGKNRRYTIKYDRSRLSPEQIGIIEEYIKYIKIWTDSKSIKAVPFEDRDKPIISVYCTDDNFKGEGHIDAHIPEGELRDYPLRIIGMLNIAFAASNIPDELKTGDRIDYYRPLIELIRHEYKAILGKELTIPDSIEDILGIIKRIILDLPKADIVSLEKVKEYNDMAQQTLRSA